ncbi:hypothetical protein [Enterobacter cloacae]|uniref:hypothetical protein n=1 Tax=Enterobacter cloacae TaxID=550 RepID=UPI003D9FED8B
MSAASDVLRPYYIDGLANMSGVTDTTFKTWIELEPQILDSYDESIKKFTFYIGDKEKLLRSIAFDISRMSIATFESIYYISSEHELPRSTAWPLIRSYYAAFFAAHTILRIFGYAVIQLEKGQSDKLGNALKYHAIPPKSSIGDGLHLVILHKDLTSFSIQKLNNGSHEDTWLVLSELLTKISTDFLIDKNPVSIQKKQDLFGKIDTLVKIMKSHPCHHRANWLSRLRNEINYQHKHGTWYPHEKSKNFRDNVFNNLNSWCKEPRIQLNEKAHQLDKYTQACTFLVSLTRELIYDILDRNPSDESFLKSSTFKALKQAENKKIE